MTICYWANSATSLRTYINETGRKLNSMEEHKVLRHLKSLFYYFLFFFTNCVTVAPCELKLARETHIQRAAPPMWLMRGNHRLVAWLEKRSKQCGVTKERAAEKGSHVKNAPWSVLPNVTCTHQISHSAITSRFFSRRLPDRYSGTLMRFAGGGGVVGGGAWCHHTAIWGFCCFFFGLHFSWFKFKTQCVIRINASCVWQQMKRIDSRQKHGSRTRC